LDNSWPSDTLRWLLLLFVNLQTQNNATVNIRALKNI